MAARRAEIRGRVQGVGFRAFVLRLAQMHGVAGEVWNRLNGAVEAVYEHANEPTLSAFEEGLHEGPGWIMEVRTSTLSAPLNASEFRIGPTRP